MPYKKWHTQVREYQYTDSVIFLHAPYNRIKTIVNGDSLEGAEKKVGVKPTKYFIHPEYALFSTEISGQNYEVALKYNESDIITDISYKPVNWGTKGP